MLTAMGHQVAEAASVEEARTLAERLEIDLVLSDITLEGALPGSELPLLLPDVPVQLMTSLPPDSPLRREAVARAPVLAKPFTPEELAAFLGHPGAAA